MLKLAILSLIQLFCVIEAYDDSILLPIKSYHGLKVIRSPSYSQKHETHVKVGPGEMPVYLTFKSKTSPVHLNQKHKASKGSYKKTKSEDEPHKLVHEVVKPVYQEVIEIIKPYRKVVQVIEPLKEERLTKVHKGDSKDNGQSYGGYGQNYGDNGQNYGGSGQSYSGNGQSYGGNGQSYGDNGQSYGGSGQYSGIVQSYVDNGQNSGTGQNEKGKKCDVDLEYLKNG